MSVCVCVFCRRLGFSEIKLGVGLNTLAVEGSYQNSFLAVFETEFDASVSAR